MILQRKVKRANTDIHSLRKRELKNLEMQGSLYTFLEKTYQEGVRGKVSSAEL